jgi:hypothetical protein
MHKSGILQNKIISTKSTETTIIQFTYTHEKGLYTINLVCHASLSDGTESVFL